MYSIGRIVKAVVWLFFGKPHQRRRVKLELARVSAGLFGNYYLSEDYKLWLEDKEFLADYQRLSPANPFSKDRKFALREFVRNVENIPGAMAECGCYEGATAWYMAKELPGVPLYLFDSFEGLSNPEKEDVALSDNHFSWQKGDMTASEEKVLENLRDFSNVRLMRGWIPTRFNEVSDEVFRFVHIDVDLYQPTKDCIEFFYSRMASPGAVMIFDDYGMTSCPGAYKAIEEFMQDKPEHIIHLPTAQGVVIKL